MKSRYHFHQKALNFLENRLQYFKSISGMRAELTVYF